MQRGRVSPSLVVVMVLLTLSGSVSAGRVLAVFQLNAKSHFVMFEAILREMALRGHTVDVISHFPLADPPPGYRDLSVKGSLPGLVNNFTMDFAAQIGTIREALNFFFEVNLQFCEMVIQHPVLQGALQSNASYDLVVTELFGVDCMLGFAHRFSAPSVQVISSVMLPWGNDRIANPDSPSLVPIYYLPYSSPMTFFQRIINTATLLFLKFNSWWRSDGPAERFTRKHFGEDTPSILELQRNVSLILVNSHFSIHGSRPTVPAFVEVAGAHIPKPKPLPKELLSWLEGAGEAGVVYISFGSLVRFDSAAPERLRSIVAALGALPQRVLWKAEPSAMPPLPANVLARSWMPQADVLAHPSVVAFVTHGGLMGTLEALQSGGVPLVVAPFFGDQHFNARNYVVRGMAVQLDATSFAGEELLHALRTVTTDPRYRERARELSRRFRDRPRPPLEEAVFWLEYVMRHRGAPHIQSHAVHVSWLQESLIDVTAIAMAAIVAIAMLLRAFIRWCSRRRGRKETLLRNGTPKTKVN